MIGTKFAGVTNNCGRFFVVVDWRSAKWGWVMRGSRGGFLSPLLFASLAIIAVPAAAASAQDMPPILAPPVQPVMPAPPASVSPSAEAVIPPAPAVPPAAPAKQDRAASVNHPTAAHHIAKSAAIKNKFAALTKRLTTTAHAHRNVSHVAVSEPPPRPVFPPGAPVPPPGYFPPSPYQPGPYQQLVYGGPPRPFHAGWGRYPYYP
jgi:hypothetical protein